MYLTALELTAAPVYIQQRQLPSPLTPLHPSRRESLPVLVLNPSFGTGSSCYQQQRSSGYGIGEASHAKASAVALTNSSTEAMGAAPLVRNAEHVNASQFCELVLRD